MDSYELNKPVNVVIEVARFGFVKRDPAGKIDMVSPLPCPFNYGSMPGTLAPDGDPVDAVVLGPRLAPGTELRAPLRGVVDFVDAGAEDPKLIVSEQPLTPWDRTQVNAFFFVYARVKRVVNAARRRPGLTAFRGWRSG